MFSLYRDYQWSGRDNDYIGIGAGHKGAIFIAALRHPAVDRRSRGTPESRALSPCSCLSGSSIAFSTFRFRFIVLDPFFG